MSMESASIGVFAGLLIGAFLSAGCGSSTSLKYQFVFNGCDTGEHSFESQSAYCTGLQSSSLNNGCAEDLRKQQFETSCAGQTFTPN